MRKVEDKRKGVEWINCCKAILLGGLCAFGTELVLLLGFSWLIHRDLVGVEMIDRIVLAVCFASSWIGGKIARRKGTVNVAIGGGVGLFLFLLQAAAGIFLMHKIEISTDAIGEILGCLCGGAASAFPTEVNTKHSGNGSIKSKNKKGHAGKPHR